MLWDSIFPRIKKGKLIKKEKKMYFDEHMTQVWYSQSHHLWCMFPDYLLLLAIKQDRLGELIFFFHNKKIAIIELTADAREKSNRNPPKVARSFGCMLLWLPVFLESEGVPGLGEYISERGHGSDFGKGSWVNIPLTLLSQICDSECNRGCFKVVTFSKFTN